MKKSKFFPVMALIVSLSMILAACSSSTPTPTEVVATPTVVTTEAPQALVPISQEELVGAIWQWVGGREPLSSPPFQVPDPQKYTLAFNEDGSLFVQADCNTSRGTYELNGSQLTISIGATTLVACEEGSAAFLLTSVYRC